MIHRMTVKQPYFSMLENGTKTVELRLYDEKREKIRPSDVIEFTCADDESKRFAVFVRGLYRAADFNSLLFLITPEMAGFENASDLLSTLKQFYSEDKQKKYGVVGILVEHLVDTTHEG